MKIKVVTHSNTETVVVVEDYNALELANSLNDSEVSVIALGDYVFSRIDIKRVSPYKEEEQ